MTKRGAQKKNERGKIWMEKINLSFTLFFHFCFLLDICLAFRLPFLPIAFSNPLIYCYYLIVVLFYSLKPCPVNKFYKFCGNIMYKAIFNLNFSQKVYNEYLKLQLLFRKFFSYKETFNKKQKKNIITVFNKLVILYTNIR